MTKGDRPTADLRSLAAAAKAAQTFKEPAPPEAKPKPRKRPAAVRPQRGATPAQSANEAAREAAGLDGPMTKAERRKVRAQQQAERRATRATLTIELPVAAKAELITAARENGRTLRAEILIRLGFPDQE